MHPRLASNVERPGTAQQSTILNTLLNSPTMQAYSTLLNETLAGRTPREQYENLMKLIQERDEAQKQLTEVKTRLGLYEIFAAGLRETPDSALVGNIRIFLPPANSSAETREINMGQARINARMITTAPEILKLLEKVLALEGPIYKAFSVSSETGAIFTAARALLARIDEATIHHPDALLARVVAPR